MNQDETTKSVCLEIQEELLEEDSIELSTDEIFNIANSQFICGALAVNKRISFVLDYVGTFVLKNKKAFMASIIETKKLKEQVSEEEYKEIVTQKRIANKNGMNGSKLELIKELKDIPTDLSVNIQIQDINQLYKEILNQE